MRLIRIGVASVDTTVGAVRSNVDRCIEMARQMAADGVTVAAFPEQVVGGYAPEDLVQWRGFIDSQARQLERFAAATAEHGTVFVLGLVVGVGGDLYNVAALVHRGRVLLYSPKEKLPTYDIFYEARTLSRGLPYLHRDAAGVPLADAVVRFDFGVLALEVCEDLWSPDGPMRRRGYAGAELIINVSASPYRAGVSRTRREVLATRAADSQATVVYANLVGGNDGLVYDGGGYVNQNGRMMLEAPRFVEGWAAQVVDLDRTLRCRREDSTWRSDAERFRRAHPPLPVIEVAAPTADRSALRYPLPAGYQPSRGLGGPVDDGDYPSFFLPAAGAPPATPRASMLDELYQALALGTADYFRKTGAFERFGVAVSGGRDSCLSLLIARRAVELLHPELRGAALTARCRQLITAVYLPSRYSSDATRAAATRIAEDVGATLVVSPIDAAFDRELEAVSGMLAPAGQPSPITAQNIQARIRGARMWSWANSSGALFIQTGNMSEKAVGYTTVGGDLEGCFSVIANLPKTVVVALLGRLLERFELEGIAQTLATTAGPELAPDQAGEDELMPFAVLDACLYLYVGEKMATDEVGAVLPSLFPDIEPERLAAWAGKFARLLTRSIFKWVQSPLVIHVGAVDLDRERALQLPVVQRTEWTGS